MLMLLSLEGIPDGEIGGSVRAKIFSCLEAAKRDIDVLGWYKFDSIAGIIFTEISDRNDKAVTDSILNRVKSNFASSLDADEIKKIIVNIYFFPEKSGPEDWCERLTLYPEIRDHLRSHRNSLLVKRLFDISFSFIALVLSAPIFAVIGSLIKLSSKGPVFFRQERVGKYGKIFTFIKFRSMYVNNDPSIHREYVTKLIRGSRNGTGASRKDGVFKIQNDPRVTRIGGFLRKTSLDELPQFINVLKGEMSLVGPRPPIPYELESYDLWHRRRVLGMKPGITGVWQVEGRSRTTFNDMVRMDLYYVANWSLWLDLKLLLKTPLAVLASKGAY